MKKLITFILMSIIISVLILIIVLKNKDSIYGTYVLDDIIYQSSLSSVSYDYLKEYRAETEFIFNKQYFRIDSPDNKFEINDPIYRKEKMNKDQIDRFNNATLYSISLSDFKDKYQYTISNSNDERINFSVYLLDNEIWLASYYSTQDNEYGFMYILKLKEK